MIRKILLGLGVSILTWLNISFAQTEADAQLYANFQFTCAERNSDIGDYFDIFGIYWGHNIFGHTGYGYYRPDPICIDDICTKIWWGGRRCDFVPTFTYGGVPYKWGGFDTPDFVSQNLNNGYGAGSYSIHAPSWPYATWATGIDCSGFVSRRWGLAEKKNT